MLYVQMRACLAMFYDSCSHDGNPKHEYRSLGSDTWPPYMYIVTVHMYYVQVLSHAKYQLFPLDLAGSMKVYWAELCRHKHCNLGGTQNQNKSIDKLIWKQGPNTDFSITVHSMHTTWLLNYTVVVLTFNKECAMYTCSTAVWEAPVPYFLKYP